MAQSYPPRRPARPPLAMRVGVTGARNLQSSQVERLRAELDRVLSLVAGSIERRAQSEWVRRFYRGAQGSGAPASAAPFTLQIVSPLAAGADRLAAECALAAGYDLYVPMPFRRHEYEQDFSEHAGNSADAGRPSVSHSLMEFDALLSRARGSFELDGSHDKDAAPDGEDLPARSYEYVGRFVVRHCDLLIAVWDGEPGRGRGGTADTVRYAANAGIPTWWIHASEDAAPIWIGDIQDLRDPRTPARDAATQLESHLDTMIDPPQPVHRHHHHNWIARGVSRFRKPHALPAEEYFEEKPLPMRFFWKSYRSVLWLASRFKGRHSEAAHPDDPAAHYWYDQFSSADALAEQYAARYRSSYVLIIALTLCALIFGACAVALSAIAAASKHAEISAAAGSPESSFLFTYNAQLRQAGRAMAVLELTTLLCVLALVIASFRFDWHERSIEYRLLAELFRKQQTLAGLGWALSLGNVHQQLTDTERLSWIGWLFAAAKRAAPLPSGGVSDIDRRAASNSALKALIGGQINYHEDRETLALKAGATFEKAGGLAFFVLLLCVIVKVAGELSVDSLDEATRGSIERLTLLLGLSGLVLPGISAAFVGIRSYAELQLLAEQSRHMIGELKPALQRVERLDLQRPLVSQDLGAEAVTVATLMLQDLEGWGRLFRGKTMES